MSWEFKIKYISQKIQLTEKSFKNLREEKSK